MTRPAGRARAGAARPAGGRGRRPEPAGDTRALALVRWTLVALILARAVFALAPTMWGWGLNHQRFLPPAFGWGLWALAGLALIPAIGRAAEPTLARAGEAIRRGGPGPYLLFGALALLLVPLSDRLYFVGDFLVRLGAATGDLPGASLFPQALPLDLLLHHDLPRLLAGMLSIDVLGAERLLGALEAVALALLCVRFARALGASGSAALVAGGVALCGGYLGLFTGYGKAFRELCLVVAAVATFGVEVARSGRGLLPLGLAVAAGITLHRSGIALWVPYAAALVIGSRHYGADGRWRRAPVIASLAITLLATAAMAPRVVAVMRSTDALHFAPAGGGLAQALGAAFAPEHLREIANLLLALSPLCVLGAGIAIAGGRRALREPAGLVLLALALPFAGALLLVHPRQGNFRDWDDFSPAAVAFSMLAAWLIARSLESAPRRAGLALAVLLAGFAPAAQWLGLNHDLPAGITRIRAYLAEPPPRPEGDRTLTWDYLGARMSLLDSLDAAADAYRQAATITPTPRLLYTWAKAEAEREHYETSRRALLELTSRAPDWAGAWAALAFVSEQLRDTSAARVAAERALGLDPDDEMANGVMRDLGYRVVQVRSAPSDSVGRTRP